MTTTSDPNPTQPIVTQPVGTNPVPTPIPVATTPAPVAASSTSANSAASPATIILEAAKKFDIPKSIQTKYEDLVVMIIQTKSMDDKERQYWFHILPVMNQTQVDKLKTILINEKVKLAQIDAKYGKKADPAELAKLNEMKQKAIQDKMKNMKVDEAKAEQAEAEKEAALLAELENL
jgi:hypothetical protein